MAFADRDDAGRRLTARLGHLRGEPIVVLGLPPGGVPVAFRMAWALGAPLDVIIVRAATPRTRREPAWRAPPVLSTRRPAAGKSSRRPAPSSWTAT
jgi:hypothetical protein